MVIYVVAKQFEATKSFLVPTFKFLKSPNVSQIPGEFSLISSYSNEWIESV